MKRLKNLTFFKGTALLILLSQSVSSFAQCGFGLGKGCPGTDYGNSFMNATANAATIEYDNFVSTYHSTAARRFDGKFNVWGQDMQANGTSAQLTPLEMNGTHFPALGTASVFKVTGGTSGSNNAQFVALASNGLYAWGDPGKLLSTSITNSSTFSKLTINGQTDGLPAGVDAHEIKMMTATVGRGGSVDGLGTVLLVTCGGNVYVLSSVQNLRGVGASGGSATAWSQVTTNTTGNPPLSNIVAARVAGGTAIALDANGNLWTWGASSFLGDNSAAATTRNRATPMSLPGASGTIKMIGLTPTDGGAPTYYVLMADGNLYAVGNNGTRQIGDWTTTTRLSWVQPRYNSTSGPVMNNIQWISPNEHDGRYPAINVLTTAGKLFNWGANSGSMLGRGTEASVPAAYPGTPSSVAATDIFTAVHTGGHTTMVVERCRTTFGYVGHRIDGSMGNNSAADTDEPGISYLTGYVPICASEPPTLSLRPEVFASSGNYCTNISYEAVVTPPGGTLTETGPAVISGDAVSGYSITFAAAGSGTITYQPPAGVCGTAPAAISIPYTASACSSNLSVAKTSTTLNARAGEQVTFTITASNLGADANGNISVNDLLPSGFTYVSHATSSGTYMPLSGLWQIKSLAAGKSETLIINATVNSTGVYTNTATISSPVPDPFTANNTSSITISVCLSPTEQVPLNSNIIKNN